MSVAETKLQNEVDQLLAEAERVDAEEDAKYGKGPRGDELPAELQRRESRLKKIRAAMAELEAEAKAEAEHKAAEAKAKLQERARHQAETGKKVAGKPPAVPEVDQAKPDPKAQRNFTDPDSRIMPDGANKGSFVQGYNTQIAVDGEAQVIVAADVVQAPHDKRQLTAMLEPVQQQGGLPAVMSADAGYYSEPVIESLERLGLQLLVPPDRQSHGEPCVSGTLPERASTTDWMRYKLRTAIAAALYRMRKAIVEPVFGQIKGVRNLRRFLLRGLGNVRDEFRLIALTHNVLKLHRYRGAHALGARQSLVALLEALRSKRPMLRRVGFRRTTTYGMGSSRGAAALPSHRSGRVQLAARVHGGLRSEAK